MISLTNYQKALDGAALVMGPIVALMYGRISFLSIRAIQDTSIAATNQKTKAIAGNILLGVGSLVVMIGCGYGAFICGKRLQIGLNSRDTQEALGIATLTAIAGFCLDMFADFAIFRGTKLPHWCDYPLIPQWRQTR